MSNRKSNTALKRKFISLERKIQILDKLKEGQKVSHIAKVLHLNEATVRTIKKNEDKIRKNVAEGLSLSAKRISRTREINIVKMEKALSIWIADCRNKHIALSGDIIKQKALKIYKHLEENGHSCEKDRSRSFCASKGWFENFKRRFSLHNIKLQGERASADAEAARKFSLELPEIIEKGGYVAEQIFNADEFSLYWKKLPSRTYTSSDQKFAAGFKTAKDRITILMCSNLAGDNILNPMLINRSLCPRAMKNFDLSKLSVHWRANKKAWMTREIFNDWFYSCFVPEVERYLEKKNLSFKVLLLVDNASMHSKNLDHPNVKIVFFPPNTTSLIQPLDQGVISTFKAYYMRQSYENFLDRTEKETNKTLPQIWKEFTILDGVKTVSSAFKELQRATLHGCWKPLLSDMVQRESAVPPIDEEYNRIVLIARRLNGEDSLDMTIQDIQGLVEEQTLDEEDLIELINIPDVNFSQTENLEGTSTQVVSNFLEDYVQQGIDLARNLEIHFVQKDPSKIRSEKFKRDLQNCLAPYRQILQEVQNRSTLQPEPNCTSITQPVSENSSSDEDFHIIKRKKTITFLDTSEDESE